MRTTTNTTAGLTLTIGYPNSVAFMYSPQLVRVTGNAPTSAKVTITLTHRGSGRAHTETRAFYDGAVRFDISRMMQILAPDVDQLFQRLDYVTGQSLTEAFALRVSYESTGQTTTILNVNDITALYGALDQGEIYGEHTQRRLWRNFPQTFNLWTDAKGETAFVLEDAYIHPDVDAGPCHECDLIGTMEAIGDTAGLAEILPGRAMRDIGLTWLKRVENGTEIDEEFRTITLIPEDCKPGDGTYLRWLNRRGEVSYWLFKNSQIRTTSAVNNNFERYYEDDPSAPVAGSYINNQKSDYREARELVLGAVGLSRDEYEDLCDLATSPLVERLMPSIPEEDTEVDIVYDGGHAKTNSDVIIESGASQETEVDGGNARTGRKTAAPFVWQRVNVAAGTYTRNIRRQTPSRQELEFIIELPERNTIKL